MKGVQLSVTAMKRDESTVTATIDIPIQILEPILKTELARYYQIPQAEIEQIIDIGSAMVTM